jgi:hypothetical protein
MLTAIKKIFRKGNTITRKIGRKTRNFIKRRDFITRRKSYVSRRHRHTKKCSHSRKHLHSRKHRYTRNCRHRRRQRGGAFPFKEEDLGTYHYDEYYEVEPEIYDSQDEGYDVEESPPTLEYNGNEYPIYTDLDESDYYIMLNDETGEAVMVKTSAVRREKNK